MKIELNAKELYNLKLAVTLRRQAAEENDTAYDRKLAKMWGALEAKLEGASK